MGEPNAYALPGGIIIISKELLTILKSESELAAILAHEMGHIENGHCFNAVKYQLLLKKIRAETLGYFTDFAVALLLRHSYSKTMEDEADEFAFNLIHQSNYDLYALSKAFQSLLSSETRYSTNTQNKLNPMRDYFSSHPPMELRLNKYKEAAKRQAVIDRKIHRYSSAIAN